MPYSASGLTVGVGALYLTAPKRLFFLGFVAAVAFLLGWLAVSSIHSSLPTGHPSQKTGGAPKTPKCSCSFCSGACSAPGCGCWQGVAPRRPQHGQSALARQQPTRPTRCSRGPPAGAGLPAGPEGRALAAWMPKRGRSMACAPMPAPRSPISLPSALTLTQGAAASAIQGCLVAPRATAATGRAAPRASAAAARRVGHRPATGGGLRLHVHGARRIGRRVVRACARDGARARLTVVELECAVHFITCACACTCTRSAPTCAGAKKSKVLGIMPRVGRGSLF